jgi:replicative DNA helicase
MNTDKVTIEFEIISAVMNDFSLVDKFLARLREADFSAQYKPYYALFKEMAAHNETEFSIGDVYSKYENLFKACGSIEEVTDFYVDYMLMYTTNFDKNISALIRLATDSYINNLPKYYLQFKDKAEAISKTLDYVNALNDRITPKDSVNLYDEFKSSILNGTFNVDFGFKSLHKILSYPHPGELLILGARPGMGKTTLALNFLFNYIIQEKKRAIMFSLEMSGSELFSKMISSISEIPLDKIRNQDLTDDEKKCLDDNAIELSHNKYLSLYDKSVSSINALRAAIRKESKKGEVGLVVVDYLQLLTAEGSSAYERVSRISRDLKLIARDFNCVVVALSQLSRKVEDREDKRPNLSDLRDSGSIEQDADYVLFLYRHSYYHKDEATFDPSRDAVNVEIAKNRHGQIGTVQLLLNLPVGKFFEEVE